MSRAVNKYGMKSYLLSGLLAPYVAAALALSKVADLADNCDDCNTNSMAPNVSASPSANLFCACCWRDCDWQAQDGAEAGVERSIAQRNVQTYAEGRLHVEPDVDAWLIVHVWKEGLLRMNFWTPILETVKVAVEGYGSVARIVSFRNIDGIRESVKAAVLQGRRPLVFTVAHEFALQPGPEVWRLMQQVKDAGAYVVQYQAEPAGRDVGPVGNLKLVRTLFIAAQMGADEVWDYTFANIDQYPRIGDAPIIRYVPPGYVSKLDLGVDIDVNLATTSLIGYMGSDYQKPMAATYTQLLGSRLYQTNNVWKASDIQRYLEAYPVQLNQHRNQTCCPREAWEAEYQHFEAFRMSTLLANKACVISAPSNTKDVKIWESMVTFVEVENTSSAMDSLSRNITSCRVRSYETYKREFAAQKLLLQSGFFKAWRPPHGS